MMDWPTFFQIVLINNTIMFILIRFPAVLNFKIYRDLRLTDNLIVAIFFLSGGIQAFMVACGLYFNIELMFYVELLVAVWTTTLYVLSMRLTWTKPPWIMYVLLLLYLAAFIIPFFSIFSDRIVFELDVRYLCEFTLLFSIFAYVKSKSSLTISKVKITKTLWITYMCLMLFSVIMQQIWTLLPSLNNPIGYLCFVILPQDIAIVLFLIAHVFFPQAVLWSDEQLYRAREVYKIAKAMSKPKRINIGTEAILDYLNTVRNLKPNISRD